MLLIIFFLQLCTTIYLPSPAFALNQESLILLQVKDALSHPPGFFSDWIPDSTHEASPCNWTGITCDEQHRRVAAVDLSSSSIAGPFPSSICRLPFLSMLSLSNNSINSTLSPAIAACANLRLLDLSENLLVGAIPPALFQLPHLKHLDLSANNFSGDIPPVFGRFRRLETLSLVANLLTGEAVPSFLTNISTLRQLHLAYNPFTPSRMPPQVGNLTNLEELWLTDCHISGELPRDLGLLKKLTLFDVSCNNVTGVISTWLTGMTAVVQVELYSNSFSGELPAGISNMTALRRFDASCNNLHGNLPVDLCSLPLQSLGLDTNHFKGPIPEELAKSPNLVELRLFDNQLDGHLPAELGEKSHLQTLDVSRNKLSGDIPSGLCAGEALEQLLLISNSFSGNIPAMLGACKSLVRMRVSMNKLSGEVPPGLWELPHLQLLELSDNFLSGFIPSNISGASSLQSLHISQNLFSGSIPAAIGKASSLKEFHGSGNNLTGEIPLSMFELEQLQELDLSANQISGGIPSAIGSLKQLSELNLRHNRLTGNIPKEIGSLRSLNYLDLSWNIFSGEIPPEIDNLKLNRLNLSNNKLTGAIPPLYTKPIYRVCFLGNPDLCGSLEGACLRRASDHHSHLLLLLSIFLVSAAILLTGVVWFGRKWQQAKTLKRKANASTWMSFHKLGFSEFEIVDCFDDRHLIGSGASGEVYKVTLRSGVAVAVKKLKVVGEGEQAVEGEEEFVREVETLGRIRHKNIVRLWCSCRHGSEGKLLVYEYMKNGSLGDWLHGGRGKNGEELDWPARYKIAVGAAEGLAYLHHDCVPAVIHRDVKPNNILLDEGMEARIADFGLAKAAEGGTMMTEVAGSWGYIAPEYAYTLRVGEKGDIYSFGMVLLELVTGKRPTMVNEMGGKDMFEWVMVTMGEEGGVEVVVDQRLERVYMGQMARVLEVGLLCASTVPNARPAMRTVVKLLHAVVSPLSSLSNVDY